MVSTPGRAARARLPDARTLIALLLLLGHTAACDESTDLDPSDASRLTIVDGDHQVGEAGAALPVPLSVRATTSSGVPVPGVVVAWSVVGFGKVTSSVTLTGPDGIATVQRTLGGEAGEAGTVATLVNGNEPEVRVTFAATALVGGALTIAADGGASSDSVFSTTTHRVSVLDDQNRPVAGVLVRWRVVAGTGTLAVAASTTDADGHAEVEHTLGGVAGSERVSATVSGLIGSPVAFSVNVTAGSPQTLQIANGEGDRVGAVEATMAYSVRAMDAHGNGVQWATVDWAVTGGGIIAPSTTQTDQDGYAGATLRLPAEEGTTTVSVTVRDAPAIPALQLTVTVVTAVILASEDFYYGAGFYPKAISVPAGSSVGWTFYCDNTCDVTFEDDPLPPVSSAPMTEGYHIRRFAAPGTYRYRSTTQSVSFTEGMAGVVDVY